MIVFQSLIFNVIPKKGVYYEEVSIINHSIYGNAV